MSGAAEPERDVIALAAEERRQGRPHRARELLEMLIARQPAHGPALNSLGLIALEAGDPTGAIHLFERALAVDPKAPPIWINLALAWNAAGDSEREIASLDGALGLDPYLLPALLKKAQALERLGRAPEAAAVYRALLAASPEAGGFPDPIRAALDHGREVVRVEGERKAESWAGALTQVHADFAGADFRRAAAYAENRAGLRKVYQHQPTDGHFPYLPAIEFFERDAFPWLTALEASTEDIRRELMSLWDDGDQGFRPYVAFEGAQPVNQWAELNHSPRWSAWFLWKDGVRQEQNIARCPATAAALDAAALLDIPGKAPTVMFSILEPHTRIPPHTGSSNARTTVHLPLVVPEKCGFRVGSETREWQVGQAWAFDDTIEHEAWNDSDRPRAILILDTWNPFLTEAERAAVRIVG